MSIERSFVAKQGLPGREWYKHRVVAASGYTSIGLPGIVSAAEQRDWEGTQKEIALFESILDQVIAITKRINTL